MNMKDEYVRPAMVKIELAAEEIIATSTTMTIGNDVETATTDTQGHRGSWGDLWSVD